MPVKKKQEVIHLGAQACGAELKLKLVTVAVHRCKKEKGHDGQHACLKILATGQKCDVTWRDKK